MAAALAVLCAVSVAAHDNVFTYKRPDSFRRTDRDDCTVCYGVDDCLDINQARCDFYRKTSEVMSEDDGPEDTSKPELRVQVDSLMIGLAEQSFNIQPAQECLPLVSLYTDCTKENICMGCRSCTCTEEGMWNCSSVHRCQHEQQLKIDHRALVIAIETLKGDGTPSFRLKRSVASSPFHNPQRISYEELSDWIYGVKPLDNNVKFNTTEKTTTNGASENNNSDLTVEETTKKVVENVYVEPEYIDFDEVLNNIGIHDKKHKTNMTHRNNAYEHDYMQLEDVNVTYDGIRVADQFINILNAIEGGNDPDEVTTTTTETVTTMVIDLLDLARRRMETTLSNTRNDINETRKIVNLLNDTLFQDLENVYEYNTLNIMKRDVSQVMENNNTENNSNEIKSKVYLPINKIINDKQKELEGLLQVREKLIEIMNVNQSYGYDVINKSEKTDDKSNSYSFYNVQIVPQNDDENRRNGPTLLEKYMKSLRRNIFVVIKDLVRIQTLTGLEDFPKDMKLLARAIKHFMRNHTKSHRKKRLRSIDYESDLRRHQYTNDITKDSVKNYLINILLLIDRDIPRNNALAPLSVKTRKIVKRIVMNHNLNDESVLGIRFSDPEHNLTNDLKSIGVNWQNMTLRISSSSPWDRLHNMKLLQVILGADIEKMNYALALIDFAHSRRSIAMYDEVSQLELSRINTNLNSIHKGISQIAKVPYAKNRGNDIVRVSNVKQKKKETLLKHIKNLLKSSKTDLVNLLRRRLPKAEIVKELAKKKLNELTRKKLVEYENVMHKWQNNLDITRKKRSPFFVDLTNRMKNILPKYLRTKFNTGMFTEINKNKTQHSHNHKSKEKKRKISTVVAAAAKNRIDNQTTPKPK